MAIEFFAFPSPNNFKVAVTLELLGLDYNIHNIDLSKGDHKKEEFLKVNPFALVPAIKDGEFNIGDSTNIVQYLVSKYDKDDKLFYVTFFCGDQAKAIDLLKNQLKGHYASLDKKLAANGTGYIIGDKLTVADLVTYSPVCKAEALVLT